MITAEALCKYLQLYIGCSTNKGRFVGLQYTTLIIEDADGVTHEFNVSQTGKLIFLHLIKMEDLSESESKELISRGLSIGRPNGYSFSNEAFMYLLSLHVDLFGLISNGYAIQMR